MLVNNIEYVVNKVNNIDYVADNQDYSAYLEFNKIILASYSR
jgi:hypothetical protein